MSALDVALEPLREAEHRLRTQLGTRLSLDPARAQPTPLPELGERVLHEVPDASLWLAHTRALGGLALAQLQHFPHNLFWDIDYPALCMARAAAACADGALHYLERYTALMSGLYAAYGVHSPIRFRYVHDFVYGFDWERWVNAARDERANVGPFDVPFLERALSRSEELVQAIAQGDPSYPRLAAGAFRNPFGFEREPEAELRLHRALLARGAIAVRAFDPAARPNAQLGVSRQREALAAELGLSFSR